MTDTKITQEIFKKPVILLNRIWNRIYFIWSVLNMDASRMLLSYCFRLNISKNIWCQIESDLLQANNYVNQSINFTCSQ